MPVCKREFLTELKNWGTRKTIANNISSLEVVRRGTIEVNSLRMMYGRHIN